MRYDLRILWVEDTASWRDEVKEIIEMYINDLGISCDLVCVEDGQEVMSKIKNQSEGFKLYDIFFIDYSLSTEILGKQVIDALRGIKIDSDILFYSSDMLSDIQKIIKDNLTSYEGIYTTDRPDFIDKSMSLIEKNAKRLLSLSNIRGFLMDHTSENDFIINSYILKICNELNDTQKTEVLSMIQRAYDESKKSIDSKIKLMDTLLSADASELKIKKFFNLPSYVFPIELKYKIFGEIIKFTEIVPAEDVSFLSEYTEIIIKKRNTIAHKKLDVCDQQKYIKYYDNIDQFNKRKCPDDCNDHTDADKISLDEWENIRKKTLSCGRVFDTVMKELT